MEGHAYGVVMSLEWGRLVTDAGILDIQHYNIDPSYSIGSGVAECLRAKGVTGNAARDAEFHAG